MHRLHTSIAAKLLIGYGLLGMLTVAAMSAVFYVGTIGVLDQNIDGKISAASDHLVRRFQAGRDAAVVREVDHQLGDGIDSDREIYLVMAAAGHRLAGNLQPWAVPADADERLFSRAVVRDGHPTSARLLLRRLPSGTLLVVGRDLSEQDAIRALVWRSLITGAVVSAALTLIGALLFHQQIARRIADIRRTAHAIEAGDLSRRIPASAASDKDEFGLLNRDINRMLDRIEHLMEGVRHVSNAIAHDLRTPLGRVRGRLDDALRHRMTAGAWTELAQEAVAEIDDLILLFERLLQIAEAESGMRAQLFEQVDLNRIARDVADMYEASAEDSAIRLGIALAPLALVRGDRNLLASAVASLVDNAIKYAGAGAGIDIITCNDMAGVSIAVRDSGPGIPSEERSKVLQRFYRLDKSRSLPGNGLGLSIVSATASLHGGHLLLEDGAPGLVARIELPHPA